MAKKIFYLNTAGVREILRSDEMASAIRPFAEEVFARTGGIQGYGLESRTYMTRVGYVVNATDYPAIADNLKNNTLLKAVGK